MAMVYQTNNSMTPKIMHYECTHEYANGENFQKNLVTARIECYEDINLMLTTSAIYASINA